MIVSVAMNATLWLGMINTVLFRVGDIEKVMESPMPILEVYYQATKSKAGATVLLVLQTAVLIFAVFNGVASITRLIWAFARDRGLPYSHKFARVSQEASISVHVTRHLICIDSP